MNEGDSIHEILDALIDPEFINDAANELLDEYLPIAWMIAGLFMVMALTWNIGRTYITSLIKLQPRPIDWNDVIRIAILMFLLSVYKPAIGFVSSIGNTLSDVTRPDVAMQIKKVNEKISKSIEQEGTANEEDSGWSNLGGIGELIEILHPKNLATVGLSIILGVLFLMVRVVLIAFALIGKNLFFIIGPFVIAFSILPFSKDRLGKWFEVFLTFCLLPVTLNAIEFFNIKVVMHAGNAEAFDSMGPAFTVYVIVMILAYVLSYWFTSFIVGSTEAGKFISSSVGAVSSIASAGLFGAGASAASAGGMNDITKAGSSAAGAAANLNDDITKK